MAINFTPTRPHRLVIHSILDTRQKDPLTGKTLPGTGESTPCDHCGKEILVHVVVAECEPALNSAGFLAGYRPVSECATIGQQCAKKLNALNRQADGCNFKWVN